MREHDFPGDEGVEAVPRTFARRVEIGAHVAAPPPMGVAPDRWAMPRSLEREDKRVALDLYPDDPRDYFPIDLRVLLLLLLLDARWERTPHAVPFAFSEELCRGGDIGEKHEGTPRVLVIGDSFTGGQGCARRARSRRGSARPRRRRSDQLAGGGGAIFRVRLAAEDTPVPALRGVPLLIPPPGSSLFGTSRSSRTWLYAMVLNAMAGPCSCRKLQCASDPSCGPESASLTLPRGRNDMRTLACLNILAAVSCVCLAEPAAAQPSPAEQAPEQAESAPPPGAAAEEPASQERARALFQAGRAAIEEGDYEGAYRYFRESYELSHRPELLFNLGNAAERLRRDEEALQYYRQFLEESTDVANRPYVNGRIRALEEAVAANAAPATPDEAPEEPGALPPAAPSGGDGAAVGGWIAGAGAAVAVVGGILIGVAASERATVDGAPDGARWSDYEGSESLADSLAPAGGVVLGLGVAAVVAGIVIAVTSGPSSPEVALRVSPTGLTLAGRFE